ncbi:2588_t:CDS:2 [Racocetra persica]|uniref:2588_t:CDS:1 n=1 Tax=Racocetra persica TaxID=160502 RepID=A0ACA9MAH7_9GLOM|nr:2588_t:CDS:2 [Racocetra persica]
MDDAQEIHNYPFDSIIKFKQPNRSFLYKIIKEGTYPNKGNNQCTIQCSINYNKEGPVFQICFGKYFEYEVFSTKTVTDAANLFHKKYIPEKGTKTSGVYLFGLHLRVLNEARKSN